MSNVLPLRPIRPDPRNGKVFADAISKTTRIDGVEVRTPDGFGVFVWRSEYDCDLCSGFETLAEAQKEALRIALELNAVLVVPA
jgi:hypothetical protein